METKRTKRHDLISSWNQKKIEDSTIINCGKSLTTRYASLLSSCLEFGKIVIANNEKSKKREEFMGQKIRKAKDSASTASQIANIINELNPNVSASGFCGSVASDFFKHISLTYATALCHFASNWIERKDLFTKTLSPLIRKQTHIEDISREEESKRKLDVVLGAANEHELRIAKYDFKRITPEYLMPQKSFYHAKQNNITALAAASMGLSEIVRSIMGIGDSQSKVTTWNLWSDSRTSHINDFDWSNLNLNDKKIAIVGQGAIGMMYNEAIYQLGIPIVYVYDYDKWEISNFSRAPHCVMCENESKAESSSKHFNSKSKTKFIGKNEKFTEDSKIDDVDLIIGAVDGFDNQLALINYSQRNQIPLLLGGCTEFSASVYTYVPKKTSSLLYQFDFLKNAYLSSIRKTNVHCTDPKAQGSQVLMTSLCAAILAGETLNVFCNHPLNGPITYDMLHNPRLQHTKISHTNDLGTNIPRFEPLAKERVYRIVDEHRRETIKVDKVDFEEWYTRNYDIKLSNI